MKPNRMAAIMALIVSVVVSWPAMAAGNAIEPAEWARLSQGQVVVREHVPKTGTPSVEAKILVDQPPAKVWAVVSNPEKLMQQERKVKKVKILSQTGNQQRVAFTVLMTRLLPAFDYVLLQELSPPHQLNFRRVSGSFKDIQGSWRLTPVENGTKTVLAYTLKLDPGPLVPRGMLLNAVKSDLPVMMRNAKQAIDKNT